MTDSRGDILHVVLVFQEGVEISDREGLIEDLLLALGQWWITYQRKQADQSKAIDPSAVDLKL